MLNNEGSDIVAVETIIYFVRHAESFFVEGREKSRGLSDQGLKDAKMIRDVLISEKIDLFFSSPYERSIETIRPTAIQHHNDISIEEDLRERTIGEFTPVTFDEAKRRVYEDMQYAYPNGESSLDAQDRAVNVIKGIMDTNKGKKIVVGTHGDIMTLMMNYFDEQYDYHFWKSTTMPDIYKLRIDEMKLKEMTRMWG